MTGDPRRLTAGHGYLLLAGVVLGINPRLAFGPPTPAALVFFRLHSDLAAIPLVLTDAAAAEGGRLALAHGSRRLRDGFSPKRIADLEAARDTIAGGPKRAAAGLALVALSPRPSAQSVRRRRARRRAARAAHRGILRWADRELHDLRHRRVRREGNPRDDPPGRVHLPARHHAPTADARRARLAGQDRLDRILTHRRGSDDGRPRHADSTARQAGPATDTTASEPRPAPPAPRTDRSSRLPGLASFLPIRRASL